MNFEREAFRIIENLVERQQVKYPRKEGSENIVVENDIVYDETLGDLGKLDLYYLPDMSKKRPIIFYIHGGGFVAGDKSCRTGTAGWYAQDNYFVVVTNYGLCPEYKYPSAVRHLFKALDWVYENAEKYNIDTDKIVVSGDSAGAFYSSIMCVATYNTFYQEQLGLTNKYSFKGAILNCGVYDIDTIIERKLIFNVSNRIIEEFSGINIKSKSFDEFEYAEISKPIKAITPEFPPTLVIYSEKDVLCPGQSELFVKALEEHGVKHLKFASTKFYSNHCFSFNWGRADSKIANDLMLEHIKDCVGKV